MELLTAAVSLICGPAVCVWASVAVTHWLSCPAAYGIFPDQGLGCVPVAGGLNHWTTRGVLSDSFNNGTLVHEGATS